MEEISHNLPVIIKNILERITKPNSIKVEIFSLKIKRIEEKGLNLFAGKIKIDPEKIKEEFDSGRLIENIKNALVKGLHIYEKNVLIWFDRELNQIQILLAKSKTNLNLNLQHIEKVEDILKDIRRKWTPILHKLRI